MVQNLAILRFANLWLEPLWNRNYISSITITFKEDIGTMGVSFERKASFMVLLRSALAVILHAGCLSCAKAVAATSMTLESSET